MICVHTLINSYSMQYYAVHAASRDSMYSSLQYLRLLYDSQVIIQHLIKQTIAPQPLALRPRCSGSATF